MIKKQALNAQYRIPELISKYMECLDFVKGLSKDSLRAYKTDLLQVFQLKNSGNLSGPYFDMSEKYSWKPYNNKYIELSLEEWKERVSESMRAWSSLSLKSRRRKLSSLNQFIVWLKADQDIDFPLILPQTKPPTQKIPNFLSVDECLAIINYIDKQKPTAALHQQKLLFYLLYGCGLRISEACQAKTADVSLAKRQLKIMGKGQKERLVVLPHKVCEILKEAIHHGEEFIFGHKPLPTRTGYERIRQLGKASGIIKPLHPHALRHSYATQLLTSGSDLRVLQQLLGHQSLSATELYTHLDIDQLASSMEKYHPLSGK